jgi:hypothetical protein
MVDKAVSIAESWITQQNIPELEQTAFAVLANPVLSYQVAFKYNINISAFNKNQCKIVKVSMDLLEVGWEQDTDQQISPNMIPIEKNNTSKVGGSYKLKMTSSVINNEAPGLGSYLVLAPANNPMKSVNPANQTSPSTNSNEKMLSQVQKDQEEDDLVELEEQWIGKWYDETHERYIVRTEDGAYRDIPLDDSATFPPYTRFRVRTPPVLVSPTTGREPIEIDVKTSHPTQRFLLIQRAPDIVTIYLVHDTSKHWDIKVRSKRGGNVILATFFTSSENDIVLISSNGIEIYSFLELKKQWKRTLTHKRTIGNCWVLPKEQMILVSGTLPPVARGFPVDCVTLQVQTKKKQKIVDHSIVKYPKFSLDSSVVNNAPSVHLCRLYNRIYCVAIDHSNMKLNVIDVAGPNGLTNSLLSSSNTAAYSQNMDDKQTISVARSFPLYGEGQMYMSVVDNLLLIHVPAIKVTLVYDIASDGDRPVANPMSLVFAQNDQNSEKNTNVLTTETKENENSPYFDPYDVKVCRPVWPHYFIEIKKSHRRSSSLGLMNSLNTTKDVWSLRVNLVEALRCSFGSSPGVVAGFLMRRIDDGYISKSALQKRLKEGKNNIPGTYAKELLLSELLSSARQSVDLGKLVSAFNVLCSVYRIALTERTRQLGNNTVKNKNGKSDSSEGMVECMDESSAVLAEEHNIFVSNSITENTEGKTNLRRRVSMVAQTSSNQSIRTKCGRVVVLQRDVFKQILQPMMIDSSINDDWTYAVMFEYLRSLQRFRIPGLFIFILFFLLFLLFCQ